MRVIRHFLLYWMGAARAETQTTEAERDCLSRLARGCRTPVEIGVWHGVTTRRLLDSMDPGGVLTAVDPFPVGRLGVSFQQLIARREVSKGRVKAVRWLRTTGADAAHHWARNHWGSVDFLFIDGDHNLEAVRADWDGWTPHLGPGAVVALHDSRSCAQRSLEGSGSEYFTQNVVLKDPRFELLATQDSLTAVVRK